MIDRNPARNINPFSKMTLFKGRPSSSSRVDDPGASTESVESVESVVVALVVALESRRHGKEPGRVALGLRRHTLPCNTLRCNALRWITARSSHLLSVGGSISTMRGRLPTL